MIKVLIIDDDVTTTKLYEAMLEMESFEIATAHSGPEGLELVRQWLPDVVVLDLMMPGMDGWQICRTIRSFSQLPILVLSAINDPDRVMRALEDGANDYLVKPTPKGVLISRLRKLADRS